jgi:hypothetical protein
MIIRSTTQREAVFSSMSYSAVEQRVRHHDHHHEWQEQN